jgi:hypothetical protein
VGTEVDVMSERRTEVTGEFDADTVKRIDDIRTVVRMYDALNGGDAMWLTDKYIASARDALALRERLRTTQAILDEIRKSLKDVVTSLDEEFEMHMDVLYERANADADRADAESEHVAD